MLWQPVVIQHPEDLLAGREVPDLKAASLDTCVCHHSASRHSEALISVPMHIRGDSIDEALPEFWWSGCSDCGCEGFWKRPSVLVPD
jgi:hypothetical protein